MCRCILACKLELMAIIAGGIAIGEIFAYIGKSIIRGYWR